MSAIRKMRKARQEEHANPINVTINEAGVKRIIPFQEYQEKLEQEELFKNGANGEA